MKMNTYVLAFVTKIMKAHSRLIKLNINLTKLNITPNICCQLETAE